MVYIVHIVGKPFLPRRKVSPVHLCPAGEPGANVMAVMLLFAVKRQILHQQRSWPHDAHLTAEDIPQLRQLVDAQRAQLLSKARQPLLIRQQRAIFIPDVTHAAELMEFKNLFIFSRTLLTEDHRASELHAHKNRRHQQQRRQDDQRTPGQHNVQQALDVFFIKPSLMPHQNIPRMTSHTRSTSSMLIFVSLGRQTPRAKRSSPTGVSLTLTKGQFAKTGCKCMGFQR